MCDSRVGTEIKFSHDSRLCANNHIDDFNSQIIVDVVVVYACSSVIGCFEEYVPRVHKTFFSYDV